MNEKPGCVWKRILGLIFESEGVKSYSIPDNPSITASNSPPGGNIIAYAEIKDLIGSKIYDIQVDFYFRYEDDQDRVKIPDRLWVDPEPSKDDSKIIASLLQRCMDKLAEEFKSFMKQIFR